MPPPLRSAHLYVAEGKPAIIAPLHFNSAGILFEQSDPLVAENAGWDVVVPILRDALSKYSFCEADLRAGSLEDWPSCHASGLHSVRAFQNAYLRIEVMAVNETEVFYDASIRPRHESEVTLHIALNSYGSDEEIARLLGKLHQSCVRWEAIMSK